MRTNNIKILNETLKIINNGFYMYNGSRVDLKLSYAEMQDIQVFLPEEIENINEVDKGNLPNENNNLVMDCLNIDSFSMARRLISENPNYSADENSKSILVLNLANPVHPGGGVRRGSQAQEEDLCRKSSLLVSLESEKAWSYYKYNRSLNSFMGSDAVMITPKVEIIRDVDGSLLSDSKIVSVMTCAAPMIRYGIKGMTSDEYEWLVYNRISGMLKVAAHMNYSYLVLGAFGCGAFGNDARIVSDLFKEAIQDFKYSGIKADKLFNMIDFAVLDRSEEQYNYKEFARNFKKK